MDEFITISEIDETTQYIRQRIKNHPRIAVILGSGLGELAESVSDAVSLAYPELPYWPVSTVIGHQGRLLAGTQEGHDLIVLQGRAHYYEGYSISRLGFPVRVMQRLGVEILVVTNAAGAVNPDFEPGELMLITDHLNLMGMTGASPLRGPNLDEFGPRFPDMSQAYDRELMNLARKSAGDNNIKLYEGVYAALAGPSFETPADLRFLRTAGADAVGMSTVPEVTTARHGGLRVLGVSGISNKANLDGNTITTHEEVLEAGKQITPKLVNIIQGVFRLL
jgi:purine-nucleoside phosphorylase